jgi:3-deoxy-D-manno-octulosonic-acid transferase
VWGKVPLYGPFLDNFRPAQGLLEKAAASLPVQDEASLVAAARFCLENQAALRDRARQGQEALQLHRGAARRQAELLEMIIKEYLKDMVKS